MPHVLGDHNRPIVELYVGKFETEQGPLVLECWSMEPRDAAVAFRDYFANDHPGRPTIVGSSVPAISSLSRDASMEEMRWWDDQTMWVGDYVAMDIAPGTSLTIGESVITYDPDSRSYLTWSRAYLSTRIDVRPTTKQSIRTHAIVDLVFSHLPTLPH